MTEKLEAARKGLTRLTPMRLLVPDLQMRDDSDGSTLVGYAAVFDSPTDIDSWEGRFIERIKPGAFARTIGPNRAAADGPVRVLFNHGMDPSIGMKPLGTPIVLRENKRGLYTETRLASTSYNDDLKALLRDGSLSGMSFTFDVLDDTWEEDGERRLRTINEVRLYEFGPVTWPAYTDTTAGIRSAPPSTSAAREDASAAESPGVPPEVVAQIMRQEHDLRVLAQARGDTDGNG